MLKTFLRTLIVMAPEFLYLFSHLELIWNCIIFFLTPKTGWKVIRNLDSSKASVSDCIPVVILRNCASELSCILAEFLNMCLEESCFPDCWKISLVVPIFKNVRERSTGTNYPLLVFFLWLLKSLKNMKILGLLIT